MGLLRDSELVLFFLFTVSVVSADVSISNSYYTNGCEGHEDLSLHNMDYTNTISITEHAFSIDSQANRSDQSENGNFRHTGYMESLQGMQGAGLNIDGEDLGYTRIMNGGNSNSLIFKYLAESGTIHADYFTPYSSYLEDLTLINNEYNGNFGVYDAKSYSLGEGKSAVDKPSSFKQDIFLTYLNKFCEIKSSFSTDEDYNASAEIPVSYEWTGYSFQKDYAVAGIKIKVTPGNRVAQFGIAGRSSLLEDKFAPDKNDEIEPYPAKFDNSAIGIPKTLIMQYKINQTGSWI